METTLMENPEDLDKVSGLVVQGTPVKPKQPLKFYVRRKFLKRLNKSPDIYDSAIMISGCMTSSKNELDEICSSHLDGGFILVNKSEEPEISKAQVVDPQLVHETKENKNSKCAKSKIAQVKDDDTQHVPKKQRFHRPRILEEGKKPRDPINTRMRTISMKRNKKEKDNEEECILKKEKEECIVEPRTPEKQQRFPKRRKNEPQKDVAKTLIFDEGVLPNEAEKDVAQTLIFDEGIRPSCLEVSRSLGPNFPRGRRSMSMPVWKKKLKRSTRKKNMVRWASIALSFECLEETLSLVDIHVHLENECLEETLSVAATHPESECQKEALSLVNIHPENECLEETLSLVDIHLEERLSLVDIHPENECLEETLSLVAIHPENEDIEKIAPELDLMHSKDKAEDIVEQNKDTLIPSNYVERKLSNKEIKNIAENLIYQLNYQKEHNLSSIGDVPIHIEDTLMSSVGYVAPEKPLKTTKDITKLIKQMKSLNIKRRVTTTLGKPKQKPVTGKVNLDPETIKEWELLMENDLPDRSHANEETESKWKGEREMFQSRIELFINRMHRLQGDRQFKQWKGSVVDSVVGVFLTQNVSDYLSSNAFMSVAAKFPVGGKSCLESLEYFTEEPQEVNDSVDDSQRSTQNEIEDATSSQESVSKPEQHEKDAKRKNKKTGIMEDETVDWKSLRKLYTKEGFRDGIHMDTVDWNAVRLSKQHVLANTIKQRGQHNELARKILKFLNDEAKENGTVDLEWLRDAPSDLVKRYLLEIEGIGLKSTECVRLLGLQHSAFPVDTNVGRIAVRLGWIPLEPLPDGVQFHQLFHYPSMDAIQKYLWPRLCKLPQETLYELHYQMITFGKVFCTKVIPNCNACPMKSECKYFASAYVSSKVLLESPEEKPHESNTSMPSYSDDVDATMISKINSIEECVSSECSNQTNYCEPIVEFPPSPTPYIPELIDIEDTPCRSSCRSYPAVPEIDTDMDALRKNVMDALLKEGGKMLNSCSDEVSEALAILTPENACIPIKTPRNTKYYDRLRTEHLVFVLPDNHELLHDFEMREPDDPSPYLLAIWQPGETSNSFIPPKKKCDSDGSNLCKNETCSYCWTLREESSNTYRGTILIPCRTAMRGGFPLNGTYFQTNEVFADHETSLEPIVFSRDLCNGLETSALYCGSSVTSIFRLLDVTRIQLSFWTGYTCMRAFNRKQRNPEGLVHRLHTPPNDRGEKHMRDE